VNVFDLLPDGAELAKELEKLEKAQALASRNRSELHAYRCIEVGRFWEKVAKRLANVVQASHR
jgi:glycosyltransferase involved in cell wall biosynthesis